ncbi:MAG: hypothetical protein P9M15_05620 [Candidatus Electryoneaceae bacterium]|nr:hypothetical protein [Candidatus Electryoneaceae bacterium]
MEYELLASKNAQLGDEFDLYTIDNSDFTNQIPNGAKIFLLPEWDKELAKENIRMAQCSKDDGLPIVYIRIKSLAPRKSRLINPEIEIVSEGDPEKIAEEERLSERDFWEELKKIEGELKREYGEKLKRLLKEKIIRIHSGQIVYGQD